MSDETTQSGLVIIPTEEKITFKSELFEVRVKDKYKTTGLTRDRYLLEVDLLENDPHLQRSATIEVPEEVWHDIDKGENAMARLYENPETKGWNFTPPPAHVTV